MPPDSGLGKFGERFPVYSALDVTEFGTLGRGQNISDIPTQAASYSPAPEADASRAGESIARPASYTWGSGADASPAPVTADFSDDLKNDLKKPRIETAPAARVWQIAADQPDLATAIKATLSTYDYYMVELGLNVLAGEAKIPELEFHIDLVSDSEDRTDAVAYDLMPKDETKEVIKVSGAISIGLSKLLTFVGGPLGQALADVIDIGLGPISFSWDWKKYTIDASGPLNYDMRWRLYGTDIVQDFNPFILLRKRKTVGKVSAFLSAAYKLEAGLLNAGYAKTAQSTVRLVPI